MSWHSCAAALASLGSWVLRPRALTLTLWARLLASDLFIHGIGGAKYDRATDELIRRYFHVEPPAMACVSATLHWSPDGAGAAEAVRAARRRERDFKHNPQRYVDQTALHPLLAQRASAIAESLRLRSVARRERGARRRAFVAVRDANAALVAAAPQVARHLQDDVAKAEREVAAERIGRGREFFFALHPHRDLDLLLNALPQVQDFSRSAIV